MDDRESSTDESQSETLPPTQTVREPEQAPQTEKVEESKDEVPDNDE